MKLKKEKEKGITVKTIPEIRTVSVLLQRINEEYEKRQKEVAIKDRANRELLTKTHSEETALIAEILEAKKIVGKMINDYGQIEVDVESAARKGIEENVLRESDVKSGKVTLREFNKKGKYDQKISEEVLTKSVQELGSLLPVIRDKNLEILLLEERLGSCRNMIRNLNIRPGLSMRDLFKQLYDFSDVQTADFSNELESFRTEWNQKKAEILLTQGKSFSGRNVFQCKTMAEAKNLQFSPLMPISCIGKLKSLLAEYKGAEGVSITLYMNLQEIEITSISPRRGLIQTGQLTEAPDARIKKVK